MKVTDELADRHWEALRARCVLHVHAYKDSARNALEAALADVPEPGPANVQLMQAKLELRAAEAKLAKVRACVQSDADEGEMTDPTVVLCILDEP